MKKILFLTCSILYSMVGFTSTIVVTNTNDSGNGSLRTAIIAAQTGDTIRFNSNLIANGSDSIVILSFISFSKDLTIKGLYTSTDTLFLSGNSSNLIFAPIGTSSFVMDSVVVINTNGYNGGAISTSAVDTLIIKNAVFRNNYSAQDGGAIQFTNFNSSYIEINNSRFIGNSANSDGGAVYINGYGQGSQIKINVTQTEFVQNIAGGKGGAIYAVYSSTDYGELEMKVEQSFLSHNIASSSGGGLYFFAGSSSSRNASSRLEVINSQVSDNISSGYGGGVYATGYHSHVSVSQSSISTNTSPSHGGGLYINLMDSCNLFQSTIVNNSAAYGGGIYSRSNTILHMNLTRSTIANNSATLNGGGIYHQAFRAFFTSQYSTVYNNSAGNFGGGVFIEGMYSFSNLNIGYSTMVNNISNGTNSGIYSSSYGANVTTTLVNSSIIAFNGDSSFYDTQSSNISSLGYNIFSDSVLTGSVLTDQLNIDSISLNLGGLSNNGGVTKTVMPLFGSVAINMGEPLNIVDAQNVPIVGVRDVGASEMCYATYATDSIISCNSYYTWINGSTYTNSNFTDTFTLINVNGCDSIVFLHLTIPYLPSVDIITACDSLTWINGITYTSSNNNATDTLINSAGCDSVVTLDLTVNYSDNVVQNIVACDSLTWINGVTYYADNSVAKDTLVNNLNCDSIISLNLTILQSSLFTDTITSCDSVTWINGITYYSSTNSVTDTLINSVGCDSIITLDLTINNSWFVIDTIISCDSLTWVNGITYYVNNNTAIDTLVSSFGCDSIVTLNLTINTVDSSVTVSGDSITATQIGATYQWINCNSSAPIIGATNQTFLPTVTGNYEVEVTLNGCVDTSVCTQVNICNANAQYSFTDNGFGTYSFTNNSTGSFTQVSWSFGDGSSSTNNNPSHTYLANGNFVVVLAIHDSNTLNSCTNYFIDTISVTSVVSSITCQAGFSVYADTINNGVSIVNSSTGINLTYTWNFGDGTTSTQQYPTHSYATAGPFNLCLTIDDGNGCTDTFCDSIGSNGVLFRAGGFDLVVESSTPLSVDEVNITSGILVFPNPATNEFQVELKSWATKKVEIKITDVNGKTIQTKSIANVSGDQTISFNTSKWSRGIYFIQVTDGTTHATQKLILK